MKDSLFPPLLVILIIALAVKASMLFGRVQEEASSAHNTSVSSVFVDSAYAKDPVAPKAAPLDLENKKPVEQQSSSLSSITMPPSSNVATKESQVQNSNYSSAEVKLLKELSKRRQDLDKIQADMDLREKVLKATEGKIDQKIAEMKIIQDKLEQLMKQHNEKEQAKILSLVKIYENMKPKDAAKIFDELDMSILLEVVSRMKEIKVAPVIASMNHIKARDLSTELARQKNVTN